ncbi:hypothetical protein B4U37_16300 [Sutcliffiella horikoshii]|uniref:Uncharacterized protein n=1 Tax=Sutcliffiella horikoshii TaxID=79883 RepID=A0ABM6KMJ4_9BACI|nr:hypothetical protein B4U37_16300 [Sutcliffiella horikoshii]
MSFLVERHVFFIFGQYLGEFGSYLHEFGSYFAPFGSDFYFTDSKSPAARPPTTKKHPLHRKRALHKQKLLFF